MKRDYKKKPAQCHRCEKPFRPDGSKIKDHPGTVLHRSDGYCNTCARTVERELAEEANRTTSWWLSDTFMARIAVEHPDQHAWHMARRKRLGKKTTIPHAVERAR